MQSMHLGHLPAHKLLLVTLAHPEPHPALVSPVVVVPALVSKLILPVFITLTIAIQ